MLPYQVSISSNHNIQLKPCSCRGEAECGDPPVQCSSESVSVKCSNWGAIRLRPSANRMPQNFKCLIMVRKSKCFVPKSAQLSLPPTRVILMSPLITRRGNHSVGVAICLIRPAPRRIAMARPAVASSLISRLGLSTPSPNPLALTSTPCCCNITPRSRIIDTQPIPAAAALIAA